MHSAYSDKNLEEISQKLNCNRGRTIYHAESVISETGEKIDDELHRIFVDTVCDDGTDIADLMSCFTKKKLKTRNSLHLLVE